VVECDVLAGDEVAGGLVEEVFAFGAAIGE
jgi:hypothetical protein